MAKIFEMPPHLADLIAAGEVVERPGSVVKELVENSIDAGASSVTVEIKNGGMSLIRVTDNGSGIARDDVETAFLRHATSKLKSERDLEAIGTLGFRGEALAAIAAVSRIELLTKERGADEGTRLVLEGGTRREKEPQGCPDGTTIIVRDLFFNTPARLKFMKNDRAEGANVTTVIIRLALSHPEVSIRYIKDGKEEYHTPGDGRMESCVYSALGREFAKGLLPADNQVDGIKVTGFVSSPANCRGNRAWQFFFINGRFIKSKLLQAAVEQAFKNSLFTGRFPVCVLELYMGLNAVDVNVHPTKMEVRFLDERRAFDAVYWAVRGALEKESRPKELEISPGAAGVTEAPQAAKNVEAEPRRPAASGAYQRPEGGSADTKAAPKPRENFYRTVTADTFRASYGGGGFKTAVSPVPERSRAEAQVHDSVKIAYQTSMSMPEPEPQRTPWQTVELKEDKEEQGFRFIGEAMNTYLLCEKDGSIFIIDKHAAHERILFDRLKAQKREVNSQLLLSPVICSVGEEAARVLAESAELLGELGFEIDDFGGGSVAIRQIPADIDMDDPQAFMEEIAEKLSTGGRRDIESMRDEVMHSVACKAAIKAGKRSEPEEVMKLIGRVLSGEIKYCPHGRPVSIELTKAQLDKGFKRA
ncbi:MAG: DNA mismatch repair endonuclease MutL [Oscillospiraceae bacterium]